MPVHLRVVVALVSTLALAAVVVAEPVLAHTPSPAAARRSVNARALPARPRVGLVGNSISWQASDEIRHQVTKTHRLVFLDAVMGSTIGSQWQHAVDAVRRPDGPDILLVELGTNDAGRDYSVSRFEQDVRRLLDRVTPYVDAVVWFDIKTRGGPYYQAFNRNASVFNRKLRRVVPQYPKARIFHYAAWAEAAGPHAFAADLVHLSPHGENEFGQLTRQAADGVDARLTTGPFWDVPDAFWAADAIAYCADRGWVAGYDNGTYRAVAGSVRFTVNRAQLLTMLWRQAGSPTGHPSVPWTDVPPWMDAAARWAAATGLATGYGDGSFRPDAVLTRAEAVRMLYRLAASPPVEALPPHGLDDVPAWIEAPVRWAVAAGVLTGYPNGSFGAHEVVTRAHAANWLYAFDRRIALPTGSPTDDVPTTTLPTTTTGAPTTTTLPTTTTTTPTTTTLPTTTTSVPATLPEPVGGR